MEVSEEWCRPCLHPPLPPPAGVRRPAAGGGGVAIRPAVLQAHHGPTGTSPVVAGGRGIEWPWPTDRSPGPSPPRSGLGQPGGVPPSGGSRRAASASAAGVGRAREDGTALRRGLPCRNSGERDSRDPAWRSQDTAQADGRSPRVSLEVLRTSAALSGPGSRPVPMRRYPPGAEAPGRTSARRRDSGGFRPGMEARRPE